MQEGIQAKKSKKEQLSEAATDLNKAYQLFTEPALSLGLSYKDLLITCAHHPALVKKLLETKIQGVEEDQTVDLLLDGKDLTLLGSVHIDVMESLLEKYEDKLTGADLLAICKHHPSLALKFFKEEVFLNKLSGRQLAELGALDKDIARTIKNDEELWERITNNKYMDDLVAALNEEKEAGEITPKQFMGKMMGLLKEDKTYMHVGVLCQNNSELANELYEEGFLDKLNGEDISYFVQFHEDLIDKVLDNPKIVEKLEGNDFRRLGLGSAKAAMHILNSDDLMKKSGPHVWASLAAAHPEFLMKFLEKYHLAVGTYLSQKAKFEKTQLSKYKPKEHDLLRFDAQFLIELASNVDPKLAEKLYDDAVNKKNPVTRYMLKLDDPQGVVDVEQALRQLRSSLRSQGIRNKDELEVQLALTRARLEARNAQLQGMKYVYMTTLAGISPKIAHQLIDNIVKYPKMFKELTSGNIRALAGNDVEIIMRVLKTPELANKLASGHLANMATVDPSILEYIWSQDKFREKIIHNRSVPILCGKYLNIIKEAAKHNGFMDEVVEAIKTNDNIRNKEVPKGYVWYLYNILFPHAEVIEGIEYAFKAVLDVQQENTNEQSLDTSNPKAKDEVKSKPQEEPKGKEEDAVFIDIPLTEDTESDLDDIFKTSNVVSPMFNQQRAKTHKEGSNTELSSVNDDEVVEKVVNKRL